jgi:hypothetical protein
MDTLARVEQAASTGELDPYVRDVIGLLAAVARLTTCERFEVRRGVVVRCRDRRNRLPWCDVCNAQAALDGFVEEHLLGGTT